MFTVAPAVTVTEVGAVADATGIVKSCETFIVLLLQPQPHGRYEITPSMWNFATYWPVATSDTSTNEIVGANTGVLSLHTLWQSFCDTFSCAKYGEAAEPAASVTVINADFLIFLLF